MCWRISRFLLQVQSWWRINRFCPEDTLVQRFMPLVGINPNHWWHLYHHISGIPGWLWYTLWYKDLYHIYKDCGIPHLHRYKDIIPTSIKMLLRAWIENSIGWHALTGGGPTPDLCHPMERNDSDNWLTTTAGRAKRRVNWLISPITKEKKQNRAKPCTHMCAQPVADPCAKPWCHDSNNKSWQHLDTCHDSNNKSILYYWIDDCGISLLNTK